jgi:hypothetical protein
VSWFAAVDWGSAQHQACLLDRGGAVVGERAFPHGGAGLAALCDWLVSIAGDAGAVAVAIEVPHGPVVDALLDRGFAVRAINPEQLDRLRDRFSVAGAKDDRRDARVAAAGLRADPHLFRPVQASDPAVVEPREWSRLAEELRQERVRLGHRVRQQLWRYYPQRLELADDVAAEWVLALWAMAPTPAKAARLREATLARLLKRHRIRRVGAEAALTILRRPAIQVAAGVTEAAVLHLRSLVARLRLASREFHQAGRKLDQLCAALGKEAPDAEGGTPRDAAPSARRGPPPPRPAPAGGRVRCGTRHLRRSGERQPPVVPFAMLASALAVASPVAAPSAQGEAAPPPPAVGERIPDGVALRVLGRDVKGPSGQVVAQIVNVLVDGSGRPLAAVLDYGGFMGVGKRRIAVAWRTLGFAPGGTPGGGGITLALTRDQLRSFPDHKDGEPIVVAAPPADPGGAAPAPADAPAPPG